MSTFHEGELAVQEQAGVKAMARRVGGGIHPFIFDGVAEFLDQMPFIVLASRDSKQRTWASILTGKPGFLRVPDSSTLWIAAQPASDDPLTDGLQPGSPLGMVAIHFATRTRARLNGILRQHTPDGLYIEAREVYGNCQKYIQARDIAGQAAPIEQPTTTRHHAALTPEQQSWIASADTFFIASAHPEGNADISHRGGNPGFIHITSQRQIIFPDYSGNMMFNTLGNIAVNPSVGLLFLDFETGRALQLTGHASIIWDQAMISAFPGAQRLVTVEIQEILERQNASRLRFGAPDYSRFNP